jgi:hypothetical protein
MECAYYFGGRHMECAYYFGGRHTECAYYFDFCRVVAILSDRSPRPHCAGSFGRPRGRMVDSRAIFLAVLTIQASSPYGQPR